MSTTATYNIAQHLPIHYDGHGLNDPTGQRLLTWQRTHKDNGGGYVLENPERTAVSAHIVHCVNVHDELVAALREIAAFRQDRQSPIRTNPDVDYYIAMRDFARAALAIAKAEGN